MGDTASKPANAFNLTVVGAAWIMAEWSAERKKLIQHLQPAEAANPPMA